MRVEVDKAWGTIHFVIQRIIQDLGIYYHQLWKSLDSWILISPHQRYWTIRHEVCAVGNSAGYSCRVQRARSTIGVLLILT